jgi:Holliday junction DNA helicase RuvA
MGVRVLKLKGVQMIARLRGTICEKIQDILVLDVNGVGYEVCVTPRVSASIGGEGTEVSLTIYTDVRETAIVLYGFNSQLERQAFLLLKKVKGIGSKIALSVLSTLSPEELMIAIGNSSITSLTKVPGIGKKSAERIIVELREQVSQFVSENTTSASSEIEVSFVGSGGSGIASDAMLAMEKLGFSEDRAKHAVSEVLKNHVGVKDAGEMVRFALSYLG